MERLIEEYRRRWLEAFDREFRVDGQRWIRVEERLPSDESYSTDGSLLLWQDHGDGCGSQVVGYFISGEFWLYEDGNIPASKAGVTITHWRQLPPDPEATSFERLRLTDAEREAVKSAISRFEDWVNGFDDEECAATLRGLLEQTKTVEK